jgi:hypothetical protein
VTAHEPAVIVQQDLGRDPAEVPEGALQCGDSCRGGDRSSTAWAACLTLASALAGLEGLCQLEIAACMGDGAEFHCIPITRH